MVTARRVSPVTTLPDRSAPLPGHLAPGTRVRLGAGSREVATVLRGERDRGGEYVVVHVDRTGGVRCVPADRLVPVRRGRRAQS
jgi:hypothetical protein